jgi:hypothetical protein
LFAASALPPFRTPAAAAILEMLQELASNESPTNVN